MGQAERWLGAVVARLSRDDLEEVYSLRLALEHLAAARAAQYGTEADFARLDAILHDRPDALEAWPPERRGGARAAPGHGSMRAVVRIAYLVVYAGLAAIGEGLVARPALLWVEGQGILRPALSWQVPFGAAALGLAALVAVATLWLASDVALGRRPRVPQHAAFLALLAACLALRAGTPEPLPPRDPSPSLLAGLRAAADELDRDFRGVYAPDASQINGALAQISPPGFRRLGRSVPRAFQRQAKFSGCYSFSLGRNDSLNEIANGCRVEMRECSRRRRVSQIVGGNVNRLHRGDRTAFRGGDALLQLAHLRRQVRLISDRARHASEQRGNFRTRLRETKNIVDEQQSVRAFHIAEVFRDREPG